jgi:acyl carrier protein
MDSQQSVEDQLRPLIAKILKVAPERVVPGASFKDDLAADSLDLVLLVYEIEDRLGISLSDEDAKNIRTVGDALRLAAQMTAK